LSVSPHSFPSLNSKHLLWRPEAQLLPKPDMQLLSWLLDPGSLTQRLRQMSHERFNVKVLEEGWQQHCAPSLLQCFPAHVVSARMWSRKVVLRCGETPWVAAHSLIPVSSMEGPLKRLRRLNERPLGEFLFRDPHLLRSQLEVVRSGAVWGRRSLFITHHRPLLVAEFFLPALLEEDAQRALANRTVLNAC
jgi:chorismate--pyruvate lyase